MNKMWKRGFVSLLALVLVLTALPVLAKEKSESDLVADLGSSNPRKVINAMQDIEKLYPNSSTAIPLIKKYLTDSRPEVRIKAARVLGEIHAPVSSDDIKAIVAMLKSSNKDEVIYALKSLRGLTSAEAIPDIVPLLSADHDIHVIRDACRTLAVIGNKDLVPKIEPLLKYPDLSVQKDALDAITLLKAKS